MSKVAQFEKDWKKAHGDKTSLVDLLDRAEAGMVFERPANSITVPEYAKLRGITMGKAVTRLEKLVEAGKMSLIRGPGTKQIRYYVVK